MGDESPTGGASAEDMVGLGKYWRLIVTQGGEGCLENDWVQRPESERAAVL